MDGDRSPDPGTEKRLGDFPEGGIDRAGAAERIDKELRRLSGREAACRLALGQLADLFLGAGTWKRLGFARLRDHTRERLGLSAREVEDAARVVRRLRELPGLRAAFELAELCWSQVRELVRVADVENEAEWLRLSRGRPVREVKRLVDAARAKAGATTGTDEPDDEERVEGEPRAALRISCPSRLKVVWCRAVKLARQMAGEELPLWGAAETIAAEGMSAVDGATITDSACDLPGVVVYHRARKDERDTAAGSLACEDHGTAAAEEQPRGWEPPEEISAPLDPSFTGQEYCDSFRLDARMVRCVREMQAIDAQIGSCLRIVAERRLHSFFGFRSFADYICDRLGISERKARALVMLDRQGARCPALLDAYRKGEISWVRATVILRLAEGAAGAAWVARARAVTVRRLVDEAEWALEWMSASGAQAPIPPPPLGASLASPEWQTCASAALGPESQTAPLAESGRREDGEREERQTCARLQLVPAAVADAEIVFSGPATVIAAFRATVFAFTQPGERAWHGLERLLVHAIREWESQPDHTNPVFARDGYRCSAPICTSRRNLHSHHIEWRSHGGGDEPENLACVCLFHHGTIHSAYYGIPEPRLRVSGRAPGDLSWEIGVRPLSRPLIELRGDVYLRPLHAVG